ncbi:MAG: leucine-rich repeat protein, partial [Lachnospiraceae bacterium]|nr:leucine-rich repeat protein [Lachnospiraceae bacterium]
DYQNVITGYQDVPAPEPVSGSAISVPATGSAITVQEPVYERIKLGDIFWSHSQDAVYTKIDHEHTNSVDWGNVKLTGWNGTDAFAKSTWRISTLLRYIDSASFAKGVYTAESQAALDAAVSKAKAADLGAIGKAEADALASEIEAAFYGLRWGNTKYPDPAELPSVYTLPNPYKFFGTDRLVKSAQDWEERRAEILDLAQFYEYGYKPGAPDDAVYSVEYHEAGEKKYRWSNSQQKYVENGTYTSTAATVKMQLTVGSVTKDISFDIAYPTADQLAASGNEGRQIPILLSYDGEISAYLDQGIAVASIPSVVSDTRTNEYAWGNRTGAFYDLYPYHRNGVEALGEVSNEMAAAWAATRVIDALEALKASDDENAVKAMASLDPEKLAVTGFSINGKYAFVAGVFDDRIDVCIPGASGASGASAWRLVYTGHRYDFTGTPFASQDGRVPNVQTASGTEMMANSIRHNRVRETELFRHFLKPFDFYGYEDGAYGFGNRLPYDQTDLIASLAPRAIIIDNTTNDYNDGCEADALSAEVAKSVYNTLGYDADDLVKFNYRSLKPSDPHGNDTEQRMRSAKYLNSYFFGTEMDAETAARLNTDPFALNVTNSDTPYNVYYGGYNTITGGSGGTDGRDGWYYYTFPKEEPVSPSPDPATPSPDPVTPAPDPVITVTEAPAAEEPAQEPAAAADEVVETKEETVTNEDGSETTTTVTEKADGSTTSVSVTKDEDGNVLSSITEEEHTKKNGTKVEEITTVNADGSEAISIVKTTKAGNVYVRTEETDAEGNVSITIEQNKADGTQTKREYAVNKDGSLKLTVLETGASSVKVPASVTVNGKTYDVTTITKNAFRNNTELEKVVIGKNITAIGKNTFRGDANLSEIVLYGENLVSISKNAFKGIAEGALFKIKGSKETYKKIVELLKKSGLDKGVKFKRVK